MACADCMMSIMPRQVDPPGNPKASYGTATPLTIRCITDNIHLMRYDENHKERTRARVLAQAAAAIRSKGIKRVGVAEIMAGAGLTHGGFYAHFASKDDLVAAAIPQMFDEAMAAFEHQTAGKAPSAALAAYVDSYLSPRHRDAQATGCPLAAL